MRKKLTATFFSILFYSILICGALGLVSCKSDTAHETQISFSIPEKVVRQAISRAPERNENVTISVKLFNSNEEKEIKSFAVSKDVEDWDLFFNDKIASKEGYKVTFEEVPLGITVYAEVSIYFEMEKIIEEIFHGRSEELEVQAGINQIPVVLEDVGEPEISSEGTIITNLDYTPITIEINKDEIYVGGDVITLSAFDQEENPLSDVTYEVKLLYRGNELDSEYYTLNNSSITISELDLAGNYSLFVIATYLKGGIIPVIADQTFILNATMSSTLFVSADGNDSNSGLSEETAFASLKKAGDFITALQLKTEEVINWTINLKGEFSSPQRLEPVGTGDILLRGSSELNNGAPVDIIDANADENNNASALTINTTSKVSIENLKLTGGYNVQGGGIYCTDGDLRIGSGVIISDNYAINYGGGVYTNRLYMSSGVICDNEAGDCGGGIYASNDIYLYGDAVVGNKEATVPADAENNSNKAAEGGGIKCSGTLYLGYSGFSEDNELIPASLTGGVYYNYSSGNGGGVVCEVDMNGGAISYNKAAENGDGVYLTQYGSMYMGGDAVLKENDIYLSRVRNQYPNSWTPDYYEASITIKNPLTSEEEIVATITPQEYENSFQVVLLDANSGLQDISAVNNRFAVTPQIDTSDPENPVTTEWIVSETGYLNPNN